MRISSSLAITVAALALALGPACSKSDDGSKTAKTTEKPQTQPAPAEQPKAPGGLAEAAGSYEIDPDHSVVLFRIKHFGVSYYHGRFNGTNGALTVDPDLAKAKVSVEVDAASVFTGVKKRDDHLRSPDFFNVKEFPKITFESTQIRATGDDTLEVTGDLSLHGVTKQVTVPMKHIGAGDDPYGNFRTGFEGKLELKRSDYGMDFMIGGLGDEVTLTIAIEAIRK